MDTTVIEITDGIFRLSTYLDSPGIVFNQYLVLDEEPLLLHLPRTLPSLSLGARGGESRARPPYGAHGEFWPHRGR